MIGEATTLSKIAIIDIDNTLWLAMHRLPYDELHLSLNKTVLFPTADVVVDDLPLTLQKAIESGARGAGLSFPWNKDYPANGFRLFQNLDEVLDYILESN